MKTLLITGFEPFGGETINPAWEAVKALPEQIGGWQLRNRPSSALRLQERSPARRSAARMRSCASGRRERAAP